MRRLLLTRALSLGLSLAVATLVIFAVVDMVPGDPASFMLGTGAQPETLAALRQQLGLDQPLPLRYAAWLGAILQGDFGTSFTYRTPVAGMIVERLQVSLPLALMGHLTPAWTERYVAITDRLLERHTAWWSAAEWMRAADAVGRVNDEQVAAIGEAFPDVLGLRDQLPEVGKDLVAVVIALAPDHKLVATPGHLEGAKLVRTGLNRAVSQNVPIGRDKVEGAGLLHA